ncbi:MAG: hypothetical protein U0893_26835 [Chloroflexota bacterium]
MASEAIHRAEAIANRDHAEWLISERSGDPVAMRWAATATFYSAVHAVSAYLVARSIFVSSHQDRENAIYDPALGVPTNVLDAYQYLKRRSVGARYHARLFSVGELRYLIDVRLATVLTYFGV